MVKLISIICLLFFIGCADVEIRVEGAGRWHGAIHETYYEGSGIRIFDVKDLDSDERVACFQKINDDCGLLYISYYTNGWMGKTIHDDDYTVEPYGVVVIGAKK